MSRYGETEIMGVLETLGAGSTPATDAILNERLE